MGQIRNRAVNPNPQLRRQHSAQPPAASIPSNEHQPRPRTPIIPDLSFSSSLVPFVPRSVVPQSLAPKSLVPQSLVPQSLVPQSLFTHPRRDPPPPPLVTIPRYGIRQFSLILNELHVSWSSETRGFARKSVAKCPIFVRNRTIFAKNEAVFD